MDDCLPPTIEHPVHDQNPASFGVVTSSDFLEYQKFVDHQLQTFATANDAHQEETEVLRRKVARLTQMHVCIISCLHPPFLSLMLLT